MVFDNFGILRAKCQLRRDFKILLLFIQSKAANHCPLNRTFERYMFPWSLSLVPNSSSLDIGR